MYSKIDARFRFFLDRYHYHTVCRYYIRHPCNFDVHPASFQIQNGSCVSLRDKGVLRYTDIVGG